MNEEKKRKMFQDVFSPKKGEIILFLYDIPHNKIKDSTTWADRRKMAKEWYQTFRDMGEEGGYNVDIDSFPATGLHNTFIPEKIIKRVKKSNIVIALTEYSASHPLSIVCQNKKSMTRCASLPMVEKRMENTAFKADYKLIQKYTKILEDLLNDSIGAQISFSTGDSIYIDLRNRTALVDNGLCDKAGKLINLPSGESYIAPYEAAVDEVSIFGETKTNGILPDYFDDEIIKYHVKNNRITKIEGEGKKVQEIRRFFNENPSRRNIAELGIGCNPEAVVTGNGLEDEKVPGLHIAYGMSKSLGGKTESDIHYDICFPKGATVEATSLILINRNNIRTQLINNDGLRFDLLE
jgi:leucyl aminopeptidase (aminopeptidase T)